MPLSIAGRPSTEQAIETICAALDAGVRLIDTADVYCLDHDDIGHNERLLAKALKAWAGPRDEVFIATKGGLERPQGSWTYKAHPGHLQQACEASLKALGVDCIDLYQLHSPDDSVPFEETLNALANLQTQGKVKHLGLSNVSTRQIEIAQQFFEVVSVQNRCNAFDRRAWQDRVIPYCEANRIAFLAYSPLGGKQNLDLIRRDLVFSTLAKKYECSPFRLALAWLLSTSKILFAIPGASSAKNILDSAAAADIEFESGDRKLLNKRFPIVDVSDPFSHSP